MDANGPHRKTKSPNNVPRTQRPGIPRQAVGMNEKASR